MPLQLLPVVLSQLSPLPFWPLLLLLHIPLQWSDVKFYPQRPSSADERASNLILFGLLEGKSLVESKKVFDEILKFVSGKSVQIKDMFRLGK